MSGIHVYGTGYQRDVGDLTNPCASSIAALLNARCSRSHVYTCRQSLTYSFLTLCLFSRTYIHWQSMCPIDDNCSQSTRFAISVHLCGFESLLIFFHSKWKQLIKDKFVIFGYLPTICNFHHPSDSVINVQISTHPCINLIVRTDVHVQDGVWDNCVVECFQKTHWCFAQCINHQVHTEFPHISLIRPVWAGFYKWLPVRK